MRAIFLADGKVFTTGFSRMSERQLALWDPVSGRGQPEGQAPDLVSTLGKEGRGHPGETCDSQVLSLATEALRTQSLTNLSSPFPLLSSLPHCLQLPPSLCPHCSCQLKGPFLLCLPILTQLSFEAQCRGPLLQEASQPFP